MSQPFFCTSPQTRRRSARFFASPPQSPQTSFSPSKFPSPLMSSCQSLQSIMSCQQASALAAPLQGVDNHMSSPETEVTELPTPPLAYATPPPTGSHTFNAPRHSAGTRAYHPVTTGAAANAAGGSNIGKKFTLRPQTANQNGMPPRKRVVKRSLTPTVIPSKRHRGSQCQPCDVDEKDGDSPVLDSEIDFDPSSYSDIDLGNFAVPASTYTELPTQPARPDASAWDFSLSAQQDFYASEQGVAQQQVQPPLERPSTPKRSRIAPEQLPLGLSRADFHSQFQEDPEKQREQVSQRGQGTSVEREPSGDLWSVEDDQILVELVLAKMRLRPEEWRDCAAAMGRDRRSVDRRWRSLMANNHVGLNRRRTKIHATWR